MEHNRPFVSVVIPSYNYEVYLAKCLAACKRQTFKDFELVIVDDASVDGSPRVIERFIADNPELRIKYIPLTQNGGISKSKNTGLRNAEGTYILFHDCDDWMDDNCLETLAIRAKSTGADKVKAQIRVVDANNRVIRTRSFSRSPNRWADGMMHATLFRRSVFEENGISFSSDPDVADDLYVHTWFNSLTSSFEVVRETIYNYSFRHDSASGSSSCRPEKSVRQLRKTNQAVSSMWRGIANAEDKQQCEYLFVKNYYFMVLQGGRALGFRELVKYQRDMKAEVDSVFADYLKNKNISLCSDNGDILYFRAVLWAMATCDRLHVMPAPLLAYWGLSKLLYFNTK